MRKKILQIVISLLLFVSVADCAHGQAKKFRGAYLTTGGSTGSLDSLPTATFADLDATFVETDGVSYRFSFDAASTDAEDNPLFVRPDDYSSAGVHVLQSMGLNDLFVYGGIQIEGATNDAFKHIFAFDDPTADRTFTWPDDEVSLNDLMVGSGAGTFVYTAKSAINLSDFNDDLVHTTDTNLTQEEVEDFAGGLVTGNTETRIAVTYQAGDNTLDFVVDDMNDDVPDAGDFGNATDLDANGALNTGSVDANEIASTAVTPGSYTSTDITVDADGRITAASNGSGGAETNNLETTDPPNVLIDELYIGTGSGTGAWVSSSGDVTNSLGVFTIAANAIEEVMLKAVNSPTDEYVLTYEATTGDFEWEVDQTGAGGSAIVFDIGDDSGDDSSDVNEIATTGDTNSIFTESAADKILIDLSNNWPTADLAEAVDALGAASVLYGSSDVTGHDFTTGTAAGNDFTVNTSQFVVSGDTGDVGIGTASPVSTFTVDGSVGIYQRDPSGGTLVFDDTNVADTSTPMVYFRGIDGEFIIGNANRNASTGRTTGSVDRVLVDTSGNVGIANAIPSEKLDVTGNIAVSGTVDGVDIAIRDHDAVTVAGTPDYITLSGQVLTRNEIDTSDLKATLTFLDADFIDLSAILHNDANIQGLQLPNVGASPTDITGTGEGFIAWDDTNDQILVNDGTAWSAIGTSLSADSVDDTHIDWGTAANQISVLDIPVDNENGTPTVDTLGEYLTYSGSSGYYSGGVVSVNGTGVDVTAIEGIIRASSSTTADIINFTVSAATALAITDDSVEYIYIDYNSGTPQFVANASYLVEAPDMVLVGGAVDEGGTVVSVWNEGIRLDESIAQAGKFLRRVHTLIRDVRVGGLMFADTGTNDLTLTAGALWRGRTEYAITSKDTSAADTFTTYYRDGVGGWTKGTSVGAWDALNYDDGTGTLNTYTNNRYGNHWLYITPDDAFILVYGRGEYNSAASAEEESPPNTLPDLLVANGVLTARLVFQEGATASTSIASAFDTTFSASGIAAHSDLSGLTSGNDHTQYQLITAMDTEAEMEAQLTDVSNLIVSTEIDTKAELEGILGDVSDIAEADGDVYTGTHDFGGATQIEIPNSATYSPGTTAGQIGLDVTITSHNGMLRYYDGATEMVIPAIPSADLTTTDGHVVDYNAAGNKFTMDSPAAGGETNSLEVTCTSIASGEIPIGTSADTATYAALSGEATMTSGGVVTLQNASTSQDGAVELTVASEIDAGTSTTLAMTPDSFHDSKRNIRWLVFNLVEAGTDCATATNIAGDFVSPISGTILQSDSTPFYLYATNSTAGTNTGVGLVVDISIGGTSIMTTNKLDFDTTEKTTTTAATPPDLTTTSLSVGDIITIDIDSIHDGTAAKGLTVYLSVRED